MLCNLSKSTWIFMLICISNVLSQNNFLSGIDTFVGKLLAGIGFSKMYVMSRGRNYPPIEDDVTFWCVLPDKKLLRHTFLDNSSISTKIDTTRPVNFLIHGWLGGLNGGYQHIPSAVKPTQGWMNGTAINWANSSRTNVCAVDWSRLANYAYSICVKRHVQMVANALIRFMVFLVECGMDIRTVQIAGHSLGAHIAGIVGKYFNGSIDAIYGLDPAGPGFTIPFVASIDKRLDRHDARYVQCVYTARTTFGTLEDCGHGNFIVNSGIVQPGCFSLMCSHSRAHEVFNASLVPNNLFYGEKCTNSFMYFIERTLFGRSCSQESDQLGIRSHKKNGRFFLNTNAKPPFSIVTES